VVLLDSNQKRCARQALYRLLLLIDKYPVGGLQDNAMVVFGLLLENVAMKMEKNLERV